MTVTQEKARNTSKILYYVFIVIYWFELAAVALLFLFFIVQFFLPSKLFTPGDGSLSITMDNIIYFKVSAETYADVNFKSLIQIMLPFLFAIALLLIIGTKQVIGILKSVSQNNPFEEENASRLTIIGLDLLIASLVVNVAKCVSISKLINLLGHEDITVNFSTEPTLVLSGFLVLILAGVFKYGSFLKKEYDATV